jgi:hypothetical protein
VALAVAAAGALLVLIRLLGDAGAIAGLVAIIAGTVLAAPYAERPAAVAGWWNMLAAGAIAVLIGTALELVADTLGGLVTALGAVAVAIAVALAFPAERG